MEYADGSNYNGDWKDNKKNGKGKMFIEYQGNLYSQTKVLMKDSGRMIQQMEMV